MSVLVKPFHLKVFFPECSLPLKDPNPPYAEKPDGERFITVGVYLPHQRYGREPTFADAVAHVMEVIHHKEDPYTFITPERVELIEEAKTIAVVPDKAKPQSLSADPKGKKE